MGEVAILSALERIESKFVGLEDRLSAIERQNDNLTKLVSEEELRDQQVIKLVTTRFNELNTQLQSSGSSGFFGKTKAPTAAAAAGGGGIDAESKQKLSSIESKLDAMSVKVAKQEACLGSMSIADQEALKTMRTLESELAKTNRKLDVMDGKLEGRAATQSSTPYSNNVGGGGGGDADALRSLMEEKFEELPRLIGSSELRALAPKITQLQTNLDVLLTGENEANALIDKLMPTITKLQKDVEVMAKQQATDLKRIQEEQLAKLQTSVEDCYRKAADAKEYGKDILETVDDIVSRLKKDIEPMLSQDLGRRASRLKSKANSSSDEEGKEKNRLRDPSHDSTSAADPAAAKSADGKQQMARVHQELQLIRKEIRRVDVMDIIEERLMPNVFQIRKMFENFIHYGPPPPMQQRGTMNRGMRFQHRPYQNYNNRGGGGNDYHHNQQQQPHRSQRFIPGTKWTYDENGKREQASDEDEEEQRKRLRSTRSGSRSRSRSRSRSSSRSRSRSASRERGSKGKSSARGASGTAGGSKAKRAKEAHKSDESDAEGEIQMMENQINKIAVAVEEIQEKMEAWLKYSKKSLNRSDENTDSLKSKMSSMNKEVESLKDELGRELLEIKDLLENVQQTPKRAREDAAASAVPEPYQVTALLSRVEGSVDKKFCEFVSMVETISSEQRKQVQALSLDIKPLTETLMRQDDIVKQLKYIKKGVDAYGQTGLQMVTLEKGIEKNVTAILNKSGGGGGGGNELDGLYVKIIPLLEDIKKNQRRSSEDQEDRDHIQKILDIVEDIKEGDRKARNAAPPAPPQTLQTDTNLLQVFNALSELKNSMTKKDDSSTKFLHTLKAKLDEVLKNQKMLNKLCTQVEDVRKNMTSDAKTLSQMNTMLQGLKASSSAHEGKFSANIRELKETVAGLKDSSDNNGTMVVETSSGLMDEVKELKLLLASNPAPASPAKKILGPASAKAAAAASSVESSLDISRIGTILGMMEKKLMEHATKQQQLILKELRNQITQQSNLISEGLVAVEEKVQAGGVAAEAPSSPVKGRKKYGAAAAAASSSGGGAELAAIEALSEKLDAVEEKLISANYDQSVKTVEEFLKYSSVCTEILNSVEDMKQLEARLHTSMEKITPRIESIEKYVKEIPNDFGAVNAAMEENMCTNLENQIRTANQATIQEIFSKFDLMEQRLAVIKKYAKHGPSASSDRVSLPGTDASFMSPATSGAQSYGVNMPEMVRNELRAAFDNLPQVSVKEVKQELNKLLPLVRDIHRLEQQLVKEYSDKSLMLEEQFEALADTVLKPVGAMQQGQDKLMNLFQNEIKDLLAMGSSDGGGGVPKRQLQQSYLLPSHLNKLEERLAAAQTECLDLLKDLKASCAELTRSSAVNGGRGGGSSSEAGGAKNLSQDLTSSISTLGAYLKRVDKAQKDMLTQSNRCLKVQSDLNDVYGKLVPNLEDIQRLLQQRKGQNLQSGELAKMCSGLRQKLSALGELESKLISQSSPSCEGLQEVVQMCATVLDRLLNKERSLVVEDAEGLAAAATADSSEEGDGSRTSFQYKYQQFVTSDDGTERRRDTKRPRMGAGGPKATTSNAAADNSNSGSQRGRPGAAKRYKVNYAESDHNSDDDMNDPDDDENAPDDVILLGGDDDDDEYREKEQSSSSDDESLAARLGRKRMKKKPGGGGAGQLREPEDLIAVAAAAASTFPRVRIRRADKEYAEAVRDSDESATSAPRPVVLDRNRLNPAAASSSSSSSRGKTGPKAFPLAARKH